MTPLNTVVDKSVIEFANRKEPTIWTAAGKSMKKLLTTPLAFMKSFEFRWMFFVYLPTFTVNNLADHYNLTDKVSHPIQKLLAVFSVNTVTSLIKDRIYTRHLNPFKAVEPFPMSSLSLLFLRDIIAMAGAFVLPAIIGREISKRLNIEFKNGERIAQLATPLLIQTFSVPIHLLALGLYNEKNKPLKEHMSYIKTIYWSTLALRCMRFLPAYGIGGIFNIETRKWLKGNVPYE